MLKNICRILLFIFSIASAAATKEIDDELIFNNCTKDSEGAMTGKLDTCSEITSAKIDIEIKSLSNKVQAKLASLENAKEALNSFNMAQQSWLKYRELQCALAGELIGSLMYTYCPMKLGIARVKELRELAQ